MPVGFIVFSLRAMSLHPTGLGILLQSDPHWAEGLGHIKCDSGNDVVVIKSIRRMGLIKKIISWLEDCEMKGEYSGGIVS